MEIGFCRYSKSGLKSGNYFQNIGKLKAVPHVTVREELTVICWLLTLANLIMIALWSSRHIPLIGGRITNQAIILRITNSRDIPCDGGEWIKALDLRDRHPPEITEQPYLGVRHLQGNALCYRWAEVVVANKSTIGIKYVIHGRPGTWDRWGEKAAKWW
jgi:hypothetical protein